MDDKNDAEKFPQPNSYPAEPVDHLPTDSPTVEDGQDDAVYYVRRRRRRLELPIALFVLTCFSTFFVGAMLWAPPSLLTWKA